MTLDIDTLVTLYTNLATDIETIRSLHGEIGADAQTQQLPAEVRKLVALIRDYTPANALLAAKSSSASLSNKLLETRGILESKYASENAAKSIIQAIDAYESYLKENENTLRSDPAEYVRETSRLLQVVHRAMGGNYLTEDSVYLSGKMCNDQLSKLAGILLTLNSKQLLGIFDAFYTANKGLEDFKQKLKGYADKISMATTVITTIIDVLQRVGKVLPFLV
ncbi:hypothetical protein DesfrDRAFT_4004 [Solidesulfovibrio fructosivorans JJ]]|uniref:Uncharacterized protein n=1 Tax=Solidesulfovibrio fructosivorans JJ] TaxID=596151 RepID=E1K2A4_SOLFR|nr:hypothetical protein [Solidesulfovibrio fructosivorans]EFL49259.1 hypothetical protein DesfrDRAFT_4004 [Solidesulfovibrio fructosivorans JJ]]